MYCYSIPRKINLSAPAHINVPSLQAANRRPSTDNSLPALVVKNGNEGYFFDMSGNMSHRFMFEGSSFDVKGVPGIHFADFQKGQSCLLFYTSIFTYLQESAEQGFTPIGESLHECSVFLVPNRLLESEVPLFCKRMQQNVAKCLSTSLLVLVDCNNKTTAYRAPDLSVILKRTD